MTALSTVVSAGGRKALPSRHGAEQRGLTMIELLVAMVIGLVIALAAISALIVTRQGFSTVDASSQLRDNGRFAADLIQRITIQSGFKDVFYATMPPSTIEQGANIAPNITGFNNALFDSSDLTTATARTAGVAGYGSDVLILRYQTAKLNSDPNSSVADKSMIDCAGNSITSTPASRDDRMVSVFHITVSQGEPSLMCSFSSTGAAPFSTQPLIQGVENFQVLYGVDGVTSAANTQFTGPEDSVPDRYLRADEMDVAGNLPATYSNWRRVRSVRIGMVLRGPLNSQQEKVLQTFYPFGQAKSSATSSAGSAMSSANDVGTVFTPTVDGRLRQVVTFTVHLRNDQGL